MSSNLRAAVVNLPRQNYDNRFVDIGDVLDLIPEGAVLVTEETLAAAIDAHWADPMPRHEKGPGCAADIVRHLREGA